MTNKNTLTWRVEQLEKNYDKLEKKVDSILENHFPSLEKEMIALRTRVNVATAINVGAVIVGALILKYF